MSIGWGLIGLGRIADDRMAPAIHSFGGNRLIAVVGRNQERAESFARKHNAKVALTRYEEMLRRPDIDAVLITTPNAFHAEQVIAAATAGKHILYDKPLAIKVEDAERAVEICKNAGGEC